MQVLEKEIVSTLAFFNQFEKALTIEELFENLYKENPLREKPTDKQLREALSNLEERKQIEAHTTNTGIAIHLKGKKIADRTEYNEQLIDKVHRWSWLFKLCPFIELVAVCNTLGFNAAKKGSDIDLFIVTSNKRLFTGRTFITTLTQMFGLRRHGKKIAERFCLSFLVDKKSEDVFKLAFEDDIYFTYWLKNLRLVYARNDHAIQDLMGSNKYWVSQYLHHPNFNTENVKKGKNIFGRFTEFLLGGGLGNLIENNLKKWQLERARTKAQELPDTSGTILSETILKFHNVDKRKEIHANWKRVQRSVR